MEEKESRLTQELTSEEKKRLTVFFVSTFLLVAVVIAGILLILPNGEESNGSVSPESNVEISSSERRELQLMAEDALMRIGNFGISRDNLTADNALDVGYIADQTPNDGDKFFVSRQVAYENFKELVFDGSPLDYPTKTVSEWVNELEVNGLVGFEVVSASFDSPEKGTYISLGEENLKAAYVDVIFESKQTMRHASADDSTWDGSYTVLEKTFANNSFRFTYVFDEETRNWKIYSLIDLELPFLLATWENPNPEDFANTQHDFIVVDTLERTIPMPPAPTDDE